MTAKASSKIAAIQLRPRAGDVAENLQRIGMHVDMAARNGAQWILLPEVCDIGYDLGKIPELAQTIPSTSTEALSELAKARNVVIIAGLAEKRGDNIFNTAVVFDATGKMCARYDKVHLCPIPPINEPAIFTAGDAIRAFDVTGPDGAVVRVGLSICYDIRFPELYRKLADDGAQIIFHPTAFPASRIEQLEVCQRARAIENQLFVVSANCCGFVGDIALGGRSMIVGPDGDVRTQASKTDEGTITAAIDLNDIAVAREQRPVFNQRRPEAY